MTERVLSSPATDVRFEPALRKKILHEKSRPTMGGTADLHRIYAWLTLRASPAGRGCGLRLLLFLELLRLVAELVCLLEERLLLARILLDQ